MAEYIDKKAADNALTAAAAADSDKKRRTWAKAIGVLHDVPAADVVPVVRGEWKWQEVELKKLKLGDIPPKQGECWCNWWDSAVNLSGFCSCGERITE